MASQFLLPLTLVLFVFHVQSKIYSQNLLANSYESKVAYDSRSSFEYFSSLEVGKRRLQIVSLASQESIQTVENTAFSGLVLYHNFPSNFIVGQIFQVRGKIPNPSFFDSTFVTFCFISRTNILVKYSYEIIVPAGNTQFFINVDTRSVPIGDYFIGLYPGTKLCYNPKISYSLKSFGSETNTMPAPSAPYECFLDFSNDKLYVKWKEDSSTLIKRIIFSQNEKKVEYLLSNFLSSFQVFFKDFVNFTNGTVNLTVQSAYSSSNGFADKKSAFSSPWSLNFVAGSHNFSYVSPKISLSKEIPGIVPVGTNITVEGASKVEIKNGICMEQASQFSICKYQFLSFDFVQNSSGINFSKVITLEKYGTYILEISDVNGQCLLNRPVYVGSFWPLIPDFSDLAPAMSSNTIHSMLKQQPQTVDQMREMLLNHVNEKRMSWGRGPLMMKENLNVLAQAHSNDMAVNNYVGDVNRQNLNAQDRAKNAGLNRSVEELVAIDMDLITAHHIMCRTPSHLDVIVRENFTEIGLGVARNNQGYIYITQLFAKPIQNFPDSNSSSIPVEVPSKTGMQSISVLKTSPQTLSSKKMMEVFNEVPSNSSLTCAQTQTLKTEVKNWIQLKNPKLKEDPLLSGVVQKWLCSKSEETIFEYTWNTAKYPASFLSGSYVIAPYSTSFTSGFKQGQFFKQPDISYAKFGIGVIQQVNSKVKVYVEFAK